MDSLKLECALLSADGQRRGKAAALALGGGGTVVGARGGGGDCVDHETAVVSLNLYLSLNLYILGIRDEAARMTVTPPLAVAPLAHGDDMRWNPNDDGVNFNP